jgi:hypothetical protein
MWIFISILALIISITVVFLLINRKTSGKIPLHSNQALAECEIEISKCSHEIDALCAYQMRLLQPFCFAEKIAKTDKTLLFEFYNPNSKQRLFFYRENLNPNREAANEADILEKLANYQIHLDLEQQKIIFWEKLFKLRSDRNPHEKMLIIKYGDLEDDYKNATELAQFKTWLQELKKLC